MTAPQTGLPPFLYSTVPVADPHAVGSVGSESPFLAFRVSGPPPLPSSGSLLPPGVLALPALPTQGRLDLAEPRKPGLKKLDFILWAVGASELSG